MTIKGATASPFVHSAVQQASKYVGFLQHIPVLRWKQLCIVLCAIWLCYSFAQLFWLLMPSPELPEPKPAPALMSKAAGPRSDVDITAIKNYHLFGNPTEEPETQVEQKPVDLEIENAVDTRLNLLLKGIIGSNNQKAAKAIIAEGQRQALYGVGEEIPVSRGVKLAKVLEQRVILDNNGRYESLWLYQEENARSAPAGRRPSVAASPRPEVNRQIPSRTSRKPSQQTLADVMKVSIVRDAGKVIGYRIRPGRNRQMFNKLGLKANDIVTSVNGINLDSPDKAMEVYKTMKGKTTAQLELKRGDEVMTVDVDLDSGEG